MQLDEAKKIAILQWIFSNHSTIVIKNEFMDAEQIFFSEADKKIYCENWSPRENLTFSKREIDVNEAWDYAMQYATERIEKARVELKIG
jgi:hypothetical protein